MKNPSAKKPDAKPPPDDPEQSARFVETAKTTGADDGAFRRALNVLVPSKRKSPKRAAHK